MRERPAMVSIDGFEIHLGGSRQDGRQRTALALGVCTQPLQHLGDTSARPHTGDPLEALRQMRRRCDNSGLLSAQHTNEIFGAPLRFDWMTFGITFIAGTLGLPLVYRIERWFDSKQTAILKINNDGDAGSTPLLKGPS
jgi:hypothetical protein